MSWVYNLNIWRHNRWVWIINKIGSGVLILTSNQSTYNGGTINSLGTWIFSGLIGSLGSVTVARLGLGLQIMPLSMLFQI